MAYGTFKTLGHSEPLHYQEKVSGLTHKSIQCRQGGRRHQIESSVSTITHAGGRVSPLMLWRDLWGFVVEIMLSNRYSADGMEPKWLA